MIKARQTVLRVDPSQTALLKSLQQEAARCWNDIVKIADNHWKTTGKWIGKNDLQKQLKKKYQLHSQTVQALTDKYAAARETTAELRRSGVPCRYPWREKKLLTVPFK
jgi:putative transposase